MKVSGMNKTVIDALQKLICDIKKGNCIVDDFVAKEKHESLPSLISYGLDMTGGQTKSAEITLRTHDAPPKPVKIPKLTNKNHDVPAKAKPKNTKAKPSKKAKTQEPQFLRG